MRADNISLAYKDEIYTIKIKNYSCFELEV